MIIKKRLIWLVQYRYAINKVLEINSLSSKTKEELINLSMKMAQSIDKLLRKIEDGNMYISDCLGKLEEVFR